MVATTVETLPRRGEGRVPLPELIAREKRRARLRRLRWLLMLLLVPALGVGVWALVRPKPVPVAERYRQQAVKHGDLVREVRATGQVEAVTTVLVGAEISGRIATVNVDYNDHVTAGQVMATFDRASLEAQRAQTNALVAAGRATTAQAKADLEQAKRNRARADELFGQHAITQTEHENAVTAAMIAEARLRAAEAQLAAQEANAVVAKTNLDHSVIRAPIDGVVITRNVDPGQTVASMLTTPTLFTVAADLTRMEVVAAVDEGDIAEVKPEQLASFTVTAWPDRTFQGVVSEVRNAARIVQDVVSYDAVVSVENSDLALKPGMTASLRIRTGEAKDVDSVPNAALHFTPPNEKRPADGSGVWTLDGDTPVYVPVEPGLSDGEWTEVRAKALSPGRQVLVDLTPKGKVAYGVARAP